LLRADALAIAQKTFAIPDDSFVK